LARNVYDTIGFSLEYPEFRFAPSMPLHSGKTNFLVFWGSVVNAIVPQKWLLKATLPSKYLFGAYPWMGNEKLAFTRSITTIVLNPLMSWFS
jgi:hypothetical protein